MNATPYLLSAAILLSACHTQQHLVSDVEQQTACTQQSDSRQTVQVFDSLLHTLAFSADSVVIELTYPAPNAPAITYAGAACNPTPSDHTQGNHTQSEYTQRKSVRITAHRPRLTSSAVSTTQTTAHTTATKTAQSTENARTHTDQTQTQTSVASPMNGTVVVLAIVLVVFLLAAVFLYLFLRKWRIL